MSPVALQIATLLAQLKGIMGVDLGVRLNDKDYFMSMSVIELLVAGLFLMVGFLVWRSMMQSPTDQAQSLNAPVVKTERESRLVWTEKSTRTVQTQAQATYKRLWKTPRFHTSEESETGAWVIK